MSHQGAAATKRPLRAGARPGTFPALRRHSSGREAFDRQQISVDKRGLSVRAITLLPGVPHSAQLDDIPEPPESHGSMLVRTLALGVCGTDREIVAGALRRSAAGRERLVLGHELLGEVIEAPPGSRFTVGDRIVGIVRRPDPVPCPACAAGEWDMCRNGQYTERGIKGIHGFGAERFRIEPELRDQGRSGAWRARRVDGAGEHRRQGVGSHRAHRHGAFIPGSRAACW